MTGPEEPPTVSRKDRYQVREISRAVNETALAAQVSVRRYRNVLIVATLALIACAISFPLGANRFPDDIVTIRVQPAAAATPGPTAPSPSSSSTPSPSDPSPSSPPATDPPASSPSAASVGLASTADPSTSEAAAVTAVAEPDELPVEWSDVASVEGWGVLGGIIGAVVSLKRIRTSRDPTSLHVAQLALKLPAGALTALFGVVLLQSSVLPSLVPVTNGQLAAYAVLFGFAQEGLTRLVDQQSNRILDNAKPPGQLTAG